MNTTEDGRAAPAKVYTLYTLGCGTQHVVTDKALAERWERSNTWRGFAEWEPDADLPEVGREIEVEEKRKRARAEREA